MWPLFIIIVLTMEEVKWQVGTNCRHHEAIQKLHMPLIPSPLASAAPVMRRSLKLLAVQMAQKYARPASTPATTDIYQERAAVSIAAAPKIYKANDDS